MTEPSYFIGYEPFAFNKWLCIGYDFFRLCYRKWLILFSLKFQRDNQQNALAVWIPPRGKPEKKAVFSPHCGDETTTNYNRAFFYIYNILKIYFCLSFLLMGSMIEALGWASTGNFKK